MLLLGLPLHPTSALCPPAMVFRGLMSRSNSAHVPYLFTSLLTGPLLSASSPQEFSDPRSEPKPLYAPPPQLPIKLLL